MSKIRFFPRRYLPTVVITTGAIAAISFIALQVSQSGDSKSWGLDRPLVIGAFVPPINALNANAGNAGAGNPPQPSGKSPISLPTEEGYRQLAQHIETQLEDQFQEDIEVELDIFTPELNANGEASTPVVESLTQKIKRKEWDIAFTTFSLLSLRASENDYRFAARMFPKLTQLNYVFFVRKDNPIESLIEDADKDTRIVLGEPSNEALFLFPIYDLYGLDLQADIGNIIPEIIQKVGSGRADVGVAITQIFDIRPDMKQKFRIIQQGRAIPPSGVYLSPEIEQHHELISTLLIEAPPDIQEAAKYGSGQEPNYSNMQGVAQRAEEVIGCREVKTRQMRPFKFYCNQSALPPSSLPAAPASGIVGKANGYSSPDRNTVKFTFQTVRPADGQIYRLLVPREIFSQDDNIPSSPLAMNGKYVHLSDEIKLDGDALEVEAVGQMQLVQWP